MTLLVTLFAIALSLAAALLMERAVRFGLNRLLHATQAQARRYKLMETEVEQLRRIGGC